jgi:diketogulonate reductase-like aldo/keto reductase
MLRRGKARFIGVSNYAEHHLDELRGYACVAPAVNQLELSPFTQRRPLVAYCRAAGVAVQAWASLTAGQALRPRERHAGAKGWTNFDGPVPAVVAVAAEAGATQAVALLAWGLQKGFGVLPRSADAAHIRENLGAARCRLTAAMLGRLDALDEGRVTAWNPAASR